MGQDKASLQWQGQSWLERAIALLQGTGATAVYVSGKPEHPLGVPDLLPYHGPPGAAYSLLDWLHQRRQLNDGPLLLIPVDMPLLKPATLQRLIEASPAGRGAHYAGEIFPCVLPASAALYEHLQQLFAEEDKHLGGKRSLRALLAFTQAVQVDASGIEPAEFKNLNTPEELAQALASTSC